MLTPEERRRLTNARKGLTSKQAQCVRLKFEGFSATEVGALMGLHKRTIHKFWASLPGRTYAAALADVADNKAIMIGTMGALIKAQEALARVGQG